MTSERTKDRFLIVAIHVVVLALIVNSITGCAAYQAIDYVQAPPREFQGPATAQVEFVPAEAVLFRCINRGIANACTTDNRITITNACAYPDQPYARLMCHELAHVNGWDAQHSTPPPPLPPEISAK